MPIIIKTPGAYVEEVSQLPSIIKETETAVPAFVGYTEKAEQDAGAMFNIPVLISSLEAYESVFGGASAPQSLRISMQADCQVNKVLINNYYLLYDAIRLFYANGGGECFVVSVGNYVASFNNISQSDLVGGLHALEKEKRISLLYIPETVRLSYADAGLVHQEMLTQCGKLKSRFAVLDLNDGDKNTTASEKPIANFRRCLGERFLAYGAAYYPWLNTALACKINYDIIIGAHYKDENGDDIPDITTKLKHQHLVAIINDCSSTQEEVSNAINQLITTDSVFMGIAKAVREEGLIMPPGGAVVGVYCVTDKNRGVWKAPANVSLLSTKGPVVNISNEEQETMNLPKDGNGKSINAIRQFHGKGTLIWGARTLAGNDNEWRYVPVRRFFIMIENSVNATIQQFVFEPNDAATWVKVKGMIENFLSLKWKEGALMGVKPEHAFFVRIGLGQTMTAADVLNGYMHVEIGMAAIRPAEFIVMKLSYKMSTS